MSMRTSFLLGALCLSVTNNVFAEPPQSAPAPLRIGVIAPLTGGVASWGLSVRTAIELANQDSAHPAELIFEDEETCVATKALSAYTFLQGVKKVDILVTSCLGGAQAIAPLAKQKHLPLFISGRSSRDFQSKFPNALSWLSLLDYEGEAVVDLIAERGWKTGTALVWSDYFGSQFADGISAALKKRNAAFNYNIVGIDQGSNPTGAEVQRTIRGNPDVVFLMMSEPAAAFVIRQLKTLHYQGKVVLQSSMLQTYDPAVRSTFQGTLQQKFPPDIERFEKLQQRLKAILGDKVADDFVFSYDGFSALLEAASSCRAQNSSDVEACLNMLLRNEHWREGASGKFRFMKDGSTERPMVFKTITATGFE